MAVLLVLSLSAATAGATGFTDIGQDIVPREETGFRLDGLLRLRADALHNLDLDRGTTPSGAPLFPVPLADPTAQTLTGADLRLRSDLAVFAPGAGVAVKLRVDVLDNLTLGSSPEGHPTATTTQAPPTDALVIRRAYGEALTPVGLLAAGRMGSHWGLGMVTNGGDCLDCDHGDAGDRIAFVTPMLGHIWGIAYDLSAIGPTTERRDSTRALDIDPSDDVRTVAFAVLSWRDDLARARRRRAGKTTFEYGAYLSHRWQDNDVPASYLPSAQPVPLSPASAMARGYTATAVDGWFRLTLPALRVEAEAAYLTATIEQPSLIPGVLLRDPLTSRQLGAALESEVGTPDSLLGAGLDAGYASGDPAPGFGAYPGGPTAAAPLPGDLDGPQAAPPHDNRADNFRFHPDYRVDRILFREIIGTVTDAVYVRPHLRWRVFRSAPGTLTASLAGVASFAVEPTSTPGGARPLGVELDPTLVYQSRDGFVLALEHAVLLPLAGLDNPAQGLAARPAQLVRLHVAYVY